MPLSYNALPFPSRNRVIRLCSLPCRLTVISLIASVGLYSIDINAASPPIVHYPLKEGAGLSVLDASSAGEEGTLSGPGSGWTRDVPVNFVPGSAYSNNGAPRSAIVVRSSALDQLGSLEDFTITCWVRLRTPRELSRLVSKMNTQMESYFDLRLGTPADGKVNIIFGLRTGATDPRTGFAEKGFELPSEDLLLSQEWLFLAIARESASGTVRFYLGEAVPGSHLSSAGAQRGPIGPMIMNDAKLMIGNVQANLSRAADVDFSDVRIYKAALAESEIDLARTENLKKP